MIFEAMGVGRAGFSICFLILLFVLVVGSSEAKRRTAKTFFSNRAYEVAMEIDEDTVRCFVCLIYWLLLYL